MRKTEDEVSVWLYVKRDVTYKVRDRLENYNLTYSGRIGVASMFYKICIEEKLKEVLEDENEFKRIASIITSKTGIGKS